MRAAGRPPNMTLVEPMTIESGGPTHVHIEPTVAAGMPPISTVGAPGGRIGPPTCGFGPSDIGQVCMSPTRAAGGIGTHCHDSRAVVQRLVVLTGDCSGAHGGYGRRVTQIARGGLTRVGSV